jgi:tRNA 2-thiouridine synthesizing protein B
MSILHTVNKSPFSHTTLLSCLQLCAKDDAILLLEDGVFCAIKGSPFIHDLTATIEKGVKVYALVGDLKARGLQEKLQPNIFITDYNGFVKLSIEHQSVQSWY